MGKPIGFCAESASAAAALSVTRPGARWSMAMLAEVTALLEKKELAAEFMVL